MMSNDHEFACELSATEDAAELLYSAQKLFDKAAGRLYVLFETDRGSDEQRRAAYDYLEDAGLVPHRHKGQRS